MRGGAAAYTTQLTNLLSDLGTVHRTGDELLNTPKIDWQINQKNHASFLFHRLRWDSPGGVQTQATNTYSIDAFGNDFVKLDYGLAKLDTLITPSISNEVAVSVRPRTERRIASSLSAPTPSSTLQSTNGINAAAAGGFLAEHALRRARQSIVGGLLSWIALLSYRKALPDERKWQIGDTAAWVKGNHSIKFGVDMVHNYDLLNNTYESNGVYTYSYHRQLLCRSAERGQRHGRLQQREHGLGARQLDDELCGHRPLRHVRAGLWTDGVGPGHHGLRLLR